MSNASPLSNEPTAPSSADAECTPSTRPVSHPRSHRRPLQFVSFWIAVVLPFVHLPLLAQGLGEPRVALAFLFLLALNAVALYVGRDYNRS